MPRLSARVKSKLKDLRRLERLGLYNPKEPISRSHITSHAEKLLRKFAPVLSGKATVVTAKAGTVQIASEVATRKPILKKLSARQRAAYYRSVDTVVGDKIVVPVKKGEHPRFNKKTGEIEVDMKVSGKTRRARLLPIRITSIDDLRRIDSTGQVFGLPIRHFGSDVVNWSFYEDVEELIQDITLYYRNTKLARYVVLVPKTKSGLRSSSRVSDTDDEETEE